MRPLGTRRRQESREEGPLWPSLGQPANHRQNTRHPGSVPRGAGSKHPLHVDAEVKGIAGQWSESKHSQSPRMLPARIPNLAHPGGMPIDRVGYRSAVQLCGCRFRATPAGWSVAGGGTGSGGASSSGMLVGTGIVGSECAATGGGTAGTGAGSNAHACPMPIIPSQVRAAITAGARRPDLVSVFITLPNAAIGLPVPGCPGHRPVMRLDRA